MIIDLKDATIKLKDAGSNEIELHIGSGNLSYTENRQIKYVTDKGLLWKTKLGDEQPMDVSLDIVWEYLHSLESFFVLTDFPEATNYPGVDFNGTYVLAGIINGFPYYYQEGIGYLYSKYILGPEDRCYINPTLDESTLSNTAFFTNNRINTTQLNEGFGWKDSSTGGFLTESAATPTISEPTPYEVLKRIGNASSWVSTETDSCQPFAVDLEIFFDRPCGRTEKIVLPKFRYETIGGDLGEGTLAVSGKANAKEPLVTVS